MIWRNYSCVPERDASSQRQFVGQNLTHKQLSQLPSKALIQSNSEDFFSTFTLLSVLKASKSLASSQLLVSRLCVTRVIQRAVAHSVTKLRWKLISFVNLKISHENKTCYLCHFVSKVINCWSVHAWMSCSRFVSFHSWKKLFPRRPHLRRHYINWEPYTVCVCVEMRKIGKDCVDFHNVLIF